MKKQSVNIHFLANPGRFMRVSGKLLPFFAVATVGLFVVGLYLALIASPADYKQGETVRIMYVHVPSAILAMGIYTGMAIASAMYLVWRHPLADIIAEASAPIGAAFCFITLVTGSLWGKPMWGAWWVWDARLTSMLILFFLYIGYIALKGSYDNEERGRKSAAVLSIIGVVNIPIIKFSVDWWSTLHQPASIFRMDGPTIDVSMLWPLFTMLAAFSFLYITLLILRANTAILLFKNRRLQS